MRLHISVVATARELCHRQWRAAAASWTSKVRPKPLGGAPCSFFQRPGLFEEMRRARHDRQLLLAGELRISTSIELYHDIVESADDEQCRRSYVRERGIRKVRPTSA